ETTFERWAREDAEEKRSPWHPYPSREEWELARFLAKNFGHNRIEEFLKLDLVSVSSDYPNQNRATNETLLQIKTLGLSSSSRYKFLQMLDKLPQCQKWMADELTVTGDVAGEDGKPLTEQLEVWRRDPVECIRELIGNPTFREAMAYAPEHVFLDEEGEERCIDEM
ncbi:hypothetical protein PHLGIDRAFT_46146, partial [Phlebiopsis gigantea 11061_1 CR5-6]